MNNMQNEGIPDISSLGIGKSAGVGNNTGAKNYAPNTGNFRGKGGTNHSGKQLMVLGGIVAVFAVIVIIVLLGVRAYAERKVENESLAEEMEEQMESLAEEMEEQMKVEKVVKEYWETLFTADYTDFSWDKYYPDEIAEEMEEQLQYENIMELRQETMVEVESFLAVSRLDGQYEDMLVDIVMELADDMDISLKKRDIDVSAGYIVIANCHVEDKHEKSEFDGPLCCFVIKVNGRYGLYFSSKFAFYS